MNREIVIKPLGIPGWPSLEVSERRIICPGWVMWAYSKNECVGFEKHGLGGVALKILTKTHFSTNLEIYFARAGELIKREVFIKWQGGEVTFQETSRGAKITGIPKIPGTKKIKDDPEYTKLCDPDEEINKTLAAYAREQEEMDEICELKNNLKNQLLGVLVYFENEHPIISKIPAVDRLLKLLKDKLASQKVSLG